MDEVRVRFAPSPTGELHVGGARTALFNWFFVRKVGGTFILRIEDTDVQRSSDEMVRVIVDGLRWLGIDWDEGPYFQSKRLDLYHQYCRQLLAQGAAYYCYCLPERLHKEKEKAIKEGKAWKYDRRCRRLSREEILAREMEKSRRTVRFLVPEGKIIMEDLIHKTIEFDNQNIEDFILLRSDGLPTYHLGAVVDDIEMRITHVIRGDDHIPNTPKQILLYKALGKKVPLFAHLPLIMGSDRKRLSKRHGATSVIYYKEHGYLSEAMVNFLALLGWSPGDDRTLMSRKELIELFSLEGVSKSNSIFDHKKLEWLNSQYINLKPEAELLPLVKEGLQKEGYWQPSLEREEKDWFLKVIQLLKSRSRLIPDLVASSLPFVSVDYPYDPEAVQKHLLSIEGLSAYIRRLQERLNKLESFDQASLEQCLRETAEELSISAARLIHATRVGLTGQAVGPGIFELLEAMGKERTLRRLERLAEFLDSSHR
ncbi:MAG: glutamate--tRNA ligase [Candidatus Aminicenantes bacterium]|nr:glutamate--tRNA ligase [Candidatus Aminicenantes bacterium]MDH5714723.1 glutamate--tRNA ligase [Candidatus Aminicenantes bacterium]